MYDLKIVNYYLNLGFVIKTGCIQNYENLTIIPFRLSEIFLNIRLEFVLGIINYILWSWIEYFV